MASKLPEELDFAVRVIRLETGEVYYASPNPSNWRCDTSEVSVIDSEKLTEPL